MQAELLHTWLQQASGSAGTHGAPVGRHVGCADTPSPGRAEAGELRSTGVTHATAVPMPSCVIARRREMPPSPMAAT